MKTSVLVFMFLFHVFVTSSLGILVSMWLEAVMLIWWTSFSLIENGWTS